MEKITVVGAGNVGASAAHLIAHKGLADVVLIDIAEGLAKGKSLDKMHAMAVHGNPAEIHGTADFSDMRGSRVVVITAGFARGPGMTRSDLLMMNAGIIESVVEHIKKYAPVALVVVVTNPLDEMTTLALRLSGSSRFKVIGMGGVLDSARFAYFISQHLSVPPGDVQAMVIGAHGDTMIPLHRHTLVNGEHLTDMLKQSEIDEIIERTRQGGAEIISHLKKGSAFYGPAAAITKMVEAILEDQKDTMSCSVYLDGEYGLSGVALGVPVILGRSGVNEIVQLDLSDEEQMALERSADSVKAALEHLKVDEPYNQ